MYVGYVFMYLLFIYLFSAVNPMQCHMTLQKLF